MASAALAEQVQDLDTARSGHLMLHHDRPDAGETFVPSAT